MKYSKSLYFDYQATTPVADEVLCKMQPYFTEYFANPHASDHALGWKSATSVENAAQQVAQLIGADADEIIFTSGATESNNLAILGLARRAAMVNTPRKRILLSAIDHKCVLSVGRVLEEQYGYAVDSIPVDRSGYVISAELERLLGDDVLLVSIMAVNNEIGSIQNIGALSGTIRKSGAIFHCDAAQAPMAITMESLADKADMISLSGHKMYGPKGIGTLYIRHNLQDEIEPMIYGGGQQNGLRSGTLPVALCVGMGAAAEIMCGHKASEARSHLCEHRDLFVDLLQKLSWKISLNGPLCSDRHPGNANIRFHGFSAHDLLQILQPHLAASTGSACTTGIPEPSHVLRAIGLDGNEAEESVRFSLGFGTTTDEIEKAVTLINGALQKLANISRSA